MLFLTGHHTPGRDPTITSRFHLASYFLKTFKRVISPSKWPFMALKHWGDPKHLLSEDPSSKWAVIFPHPNNGPFCQKSPSLPAATANFGRSAGESRSFPKLEVVQDGFFNCTLPETNIAPENRPSQKETSIPTIHFQGLR